MSGKQTLNPELNALIKKAAPIAFRQQEYPGSFSRTIEIILSEKGVSPAKLAAMLNIDRRTVYRLLADDEYQTTKQLVIGICVVLKMYPQDAFALLEKAGFRLRMTSAQDAAYFTVLCNCDHFTLEEINDVLTGKGFVPIGPKVREYR